MNPKGNTCFVEPFRNLKDIKRIKKHVESDAKKYALFVVGINTAFRAGDLLRLKVEDVKDLKAGEDFIIREEKTQTIRRRRQIVQRCDRTHDTFLCQQSNQILGPKVKDKRKLWLSFAEEKLGLSSVENVWD